MHGRWFNLAVFALWAAAMSWLVLVKIRPTLAVGDPPSRRDMLAAQTEEQRVGYLVRWEGEEIGCSLVEGKRLTSGATLIESQIRFENLPIRRMLPEGLFTMFGLDDSVPDRLEVCAGNQVLFHPSGQLQRFESSVSLDPGLAAIRVEGLVIRETLVLTIRAGGATYRVRRRLPSNVMVSNSLMPQTRMPGLWSGRRWTIEVYSPLRPHTAPMEILQAEVVGRDRIRWGGRFEDVWLVVYRGDPGGDATHAGRERAWLWVRDDGVVLQHEIAVLDGRLTFARVPPVQIAELKRRIQTSGETVRITDERDSEVRPFDNADDKIETEMEAETEQP